MGDIVTRSGYLGVGRRSLSEADEDSDGYDIVTPIGLSDKALGKRRVVEEEDERTYPTLLLHPLIIDHPNRSL